MKKSLLRNMVLGDFKAAGALPEMVQVGNEITNGMIWPLGKLPPAVNGKTLASFVASGLKAVHDTDAGIKTMKLDYAAVAKTMPQRIARATALLEGREPPAE